MYNKESKGVVIGIDEATNRLPKSVCNVIMHVPFPLFIEYLPADLNRETTANAVGKVEDLIKRLDGLVRIKISATFISD